MSCASCSADGLDCGSASALHLERLPRTVELVRAPDGSAELVYVDQRLLPGELVFTRTHDWRQVVDAIKTLAVRGAPAIGVAGAAAVALWANNGGSVRATACGCGEACSRFLEELATVAHEVAEARPTAVNLAWGVARVEALAHAMGEGASARAMGACACTADSAHATGDADSDVAADAARATSDLSEIADALFAEVKRMESEDEATNRAIGAHGAALLPERPGGVRLLTHCNAGSLATVFYGTALGVAYAAAERGALAHVYADETRPVGQGARLSVWELARAGVPCTLICDDMAASLMAQGKVDAVVVGADRIAANGDVANKIGTYGLAVLARYHGVPFYVAAPSSSVDVTCENGAAIPIEERDPAEVLVHPLEGVGVWNPAFDVTPAALVTRIITERGAFAPEEVAAALRRFPG